MNRLAYIGSFPPPYGGVTVKNSVLFDSISSRMGITRVDLSMVKRFRLVDLSRFIKEMASPSGGLVIGTSDSWRRRITMALNRTNRGKMRRSVVFVMGGSSLDDPRYAHALSNYKAVYVETEGMKRNYEAMGLLNVRVFPNCRKRREADIVIGGHQGRLSCVYFSLISEEKGAPLILDVASMLPSVDFHMYGRIDPAIEDGFLKRCDELDNVHYHGVFDSVEGYVIAELSQYDIHLFPSLCPNEGVPGVLVETKMAGVPTIASDRCFNGELVQDGETGFVLTDISAESFASAIRKFDSDRQMLMGMKYASLRSAERFYIEKYIDDIVSTLAD